MTVTATSETRKQYTGNSGYTTSTDFTASFKYLATSEIQVVHTNTSTSTDTTYVEGTHYTVTSGASADSVTIRFLSSYVPTATTEYITISRNMSFSQDTDYTEGSALDAETLEQNFDKAIMIAQQINNNLTDLNISFTATNDFNTTAAAASDITVSKANRASKAIKFDANGDVGVSTYDPDEQVADATTQAGNAATSATLAGNYANKVDGAVTGTEYSSKAWAVGGTGVTDTASRGAAKEWATAAEDDLVDGSEYSAKHYSAKASTSETNAAASEAAAAASAAAAAAVFDTFDDKYLGQMADTATATSASTTGTWAKNSSVIAVASATNIAVGQEVTGSGIPADANVISISGTDITISENMAAAGSGVSITFTGQGVYGNFDGTKDGPSTDNDGDALAQGMLYFNTTDSEMRVYDGANWIPASAAANVTILEYTYTVAGSPTAAFTGSDDDGASLAFASQESVQVYLNGVLLVAGASNDYTLDASSNTVTLASNAVVGDVVRVVVYKTFTVGDAVPASTGGTFSGDVTFGGDIQINGGEIKDANGAESIKITSTSSAVNELTVVNSATGNPPEIQATGDDTNIHLKLTPKGTGGVSVGDILHAFLPVGMISPFGITTVPAGWLYCNGATLGNASSGATNASDDYEALFDLIKNLWGNSGGTFSSGDTISLPNLKGAFLRNIDTGVYNTRNKVGPTNVGDYQEDRFQDHRHFMRDGGDGSGSYLALQMFTQDQSGVNEINQNINTAVNNGYKEQNNNDTPRSGLDTRAYNAGVKYCIKY